MGTFTSVETNRKMMYTENSKTKAFLLVSLTLLAIVVSSCDSKKTTDNTKPPLEVKEAEAKDPTRLDSARTDVEPSWGHDDAVVDSTE